MSAMESIEDQSLLRDTLPYSVINAINTDKESAKSISRNTFNCISLRHRIHMTGSVSLQYYACDVYYEFKEENKNYRVWEAYYRNYGKWQKIADSLFTIAKLNNDAALGTFHYDRLQDCFLRREQVEHFG